MKRTRLVRRTPLRTTTRIRQVSARRAAEIAAGAVPRMSAKRPADTGPGRTVLALVNARSGGVCEFAGCVAVAEHTHHRRPRAMGGSARPDTNRAANLLRLCARHHEWVESHRMDAHLLGLLLHQRQVPARVPVALRHAVDPVWLDDAGGWTAYAEAVAA